MEFHLNETGSLKGKVGEGLDNETSSEAMSALVEGFYCCLGGSLPRQREALCPKRPQLEDLDGSHEYNTSTIVIERLSSSIATLDGKMLI